MIETIIKVIVVAVVLYLVYLVVSWAIAPLGIPAIALTIVGILLLLAFILYVVRAFGISF